MKEVKYAVFIEFEAKLVGMHSFHSTFIDGTQSVYYKF